ncbi:MAG: hypothetical protein LBK69_08250, partial [Syntrophomonadaceae bacterium]|nr:hypothetical protein [Syntrophomonadaceae bacterium]
FHDLGYDCERRTVNPIMKYAMKIPGRSSACAPNERNALRSVLWYNSWQKSIAAGRTVLGEHGK